MYCILCYILKVLTVTLTDIIFKRAIKIGGINVHKLFKIPTKDNLTHHIRAELENLNLIKKPQKRFLRYVDMLAFDEMGKSSA